jgi:transposase InsO family protein
VEKVNYPITMMCLVLGVSRSRYYEWTKKRKSRRAQEDEELLKKIREIYKKRKGRYGSPRIHEDLKDMGYCIGRKRVARIMREKGIVARTKRRFRVTTDSNHNFPTADNLLKRDFHTDAPDKVWVGDITYVWTDEGWLYLAVIIDLFSRAVVGWAMDRHIKTELTLRALHMAIGQRRPDKGLIFHSDRGVQYASTDYREALKNHGMLSSMSRKGDCWDNAVSESFFGKLKTEEDNDMQFRTRNVARHEIFKFIEIWYNRERRHSYVGNISPMNFEKLYYCQEKGKAA